MPATPPTVEDRQPPPIERDPVAVVDSRDEVDTSTAATTTLLAAAHNAGKLNDHDGAIAYLERAVRIEPRNAELWIALSDAHLAAANLAAATQHARKAIALAGADERLVRQAWLQLADIREAQGNLSEARAIRSRYQSMRG
jgi:tetratricopeptide (TPR) repeat protein